MANSKTNTQEKLNSIKFEELVEGEKYSVLKSGFRKVDSKRGDFISYWFVIKNEKGDTAITSLTGNRATKALALFNMRAFGMESCGGFNIKTISKLTTPTGYTDVMFEIEPWEKKKNIDVGSLEDFEPITDEKAPF